MNSAVVLLNPTPHCESSANKKHAEALVPSEQALIISGFSESSPPPKADEDMSRKDIIGHHVSFVVR